MQTVSVNLVLPESEDAATLAGTRLAVNLAARLYPRIILSGRGRLPAECAAMAAAINPAIDVQCESPSDNQPQLVLFSGEEPSPQRVVVSASGWDARVDIVDADSATASPLAALAAAALGVGELFRLVFANELGKRARRAPQPGGFNLVTNAGSGDSRLEIPSRFELGRFHLVGAGAIGEACALALGEVAGASGELIVVDPETVELSNLQRYVLTADADVGRSKVDLIASALSGQFEVTTVEAIWGGAASAGPGADTVLVALDSATARIAVGASVPRRTFNAWTQPADLGWSRHENFGVDPCLACLYYPTATRAGDHEVIAAALQQHPLRVLGYLVERVTVGGPLANVPAVAGMPPPEDAARWLNESLLGDLVISGRISADAASEWAARTISELYRDGVCAGGIIGLGPTDADAIVPLAHQSALAGIMLATQLVVAVSPTLATVRPVAKESRFDVLRGFPQILGRPRERTPGCFCSDPDYLPASRA